MAFKLRPQPTPVRCYMQTHRLNLELMLSGGLRPIADMWKVKLQSRPMMTIRVIQTAMIDYEVSVGNMPKSFTAQAWVGIAMKRTPKTSRVEDLQKFAKLATSAKLPHKNLRGAGKPKIRNGAVIWWFWSEGLPARIEDRIYFLDGHKELNLDLDLVYPDIFPKLLAPLTYLSCQLKAGDHRG